MSTKLNQETYEVNKDNLIHDYLRIIDAKNVTVHVETGGGTIKRGQIIDFSEGKFKLHKDGGTANCICAADTTYTADETEVIVSVYISGNYRKAYCISDVDLNETDVENLRSSGIILK